MTFVWFTCPEHYPEFIRSLDRVRELHPSALAVAVIQPNDPSPPAFGIEIHRREFDRGFHLSGTPATIGIIGALAEIATFATGPIVKIDSDMILSRPFPDGAAGVCFRRPNTSMVGLYSLPLETAARLTEMVGENQTKGLHPEATVICRFAARFGLPVVEIPGNLPAFVECIPYGKRANRKTLTNATNLQ